MQVPPRYGRRRSATFGSRRDQSAMAAEQCSRLLHSYHGRSSVTANNNRIYRHRLSGTPYVVSSAFVPSVFFLFFYLFVRTARVTHVRHGGGDGSTYREPCNSICEQRCYPVVLVRKKNIRVRDT